MPERTSVDKRAAALRLWVIMNRAHASIGDVLRRQVESRGLSFTEFAVLEALLHKGALPIGELGDRILLTSGSMTYVVDKLEKRGLIRRRACAEDRRVIYAELTGEGRDLIGEVFPEHAALLADVTAPLTTEELETAAKLLKRIGLHARSMNPATAPIES